MEGYDFICDGGEEFGYIGINCENNSDGNSMSLCNVSISRWDISSHDQRTTTEKPSSTPAECKCTPPDSENTESETTSIIIKFNDNTNNSSNSTIVAALGALVGLLLLLLVAVTAVLAWTCWQLKKWKRMKFDAEYQLRYVKIHRQN